MGRLFKCIETLQGSPQLFEIFSGQINVYRQIIFAAHEIYRDFQGWHSLRKISLTQFIDNARLWQE